MTTRRRIEGPVADRLATLASAHPGWSAADLHRALRDEKTNTFPISLRTAQRWFRDWTGADTSEPWSMLDSDPEDVPLVLEVVRPRLQGWPSATVGDAAVWPTQKVAGWIARIRRGYPDLADAQLAHYLASIAARGDVELVQSYLAFTPWRDPEDLFDAVNRGSVSSDVLLWGLVSDFEVWLYEQEQRHARAKAEWAAEQAARSDRKRERQQFVERMEQAAKETDE